LKTDGPLQRQMIRVARPIMITVLVAMVIVALWTPINHPVIASRWFSLPNFWFFTPVPVLVLLASYFIVRTLNDDPHVAPFMWSLVMIFLAYSGLVISVWPNIVPPSISIRDAAAPPQSLGFTLVGALLVIPMILGYSAWAYYVFRGKVKAGEGYH
jgi:cytochrome d ubiquinol oxidase subunit II